jgi:hypothetical protein
VLALFALGWSRPFASVKAGFHVGKTRSGGFVSKLLFEAFRLSNRPALLDSTFEGVHIRVPLGRVACGFSAGLRGLTDRLHGPLRVSWWTRCGG